MRLLRPLMLLLAFLALPQPAHAGTEPFEAPELEALLAPVALQPDAVLWQVLDAATTPDEVLEAAEWSSANPGFTGSDAVRAVQGRDWQPAVKALVAYPELLARMAESPGWLDDLGAAYAAQQADVLAAVQVLRQRAHASGHLQSDAYQSVQIVDHAIAVRPVVSHVYAVRYYDPFIAFGAWPWIYRPVHWRPWAPKPVFVNHPVVIVHKPAHVIVHTKPHHHHGVKKRIERAHRQHAREREHRFHERKWHAGERHRWAQERAERWRNGLASPAERQQRRQSRDYVERHGQVAPGVQPYRRIPEANRRPIVRSHDRPVFGFSGSLRPSAVPSGGAAHRGTFSGTRPRPR